MVDGSYAAAGALTGFVVGLTGVGGGALMTPILLLLFGVAPTTAIATDLWFAAITKLVGARIHYGAGQVDWQVVRRLWAGSLPMALGVVVLVSLGSPLGKIGSLTHAIGVVVLITAVGLLLSPRLLAAARHRRLNNPVKLKGKERTEEIKFLEGFLRLESNAILGRIRARKNSQLSALRYQKRAINQLVKGVKTVAKGEEF